MSIGQSGHQAALARARDYSRRIVSEGAEPDDLIGLKSAEQEAKVAAKVIQVGFEIEDSLLDILA